MINKLNIVILFAFVSLLILFVDLPFALFVNSITTDDVRWVFSCITMLAEPFALILMTVIIYGYNYAVKNNNLEELLVKFLIQAQVILYSSILIQTLKYLFGRYRLKLFFENGDYGFSLMNSFGYANSSFPSGHSSIIFTFVTIVMLLFNVESLKVRIAVYLFASIVALSRVVINAHYISDVIVGCCLGYLFSVYAFKYKNKLISF